MYLRWLIGLALLVQPSIGLARNIVLSNDDGLSSNVKALYDALKAQGHDVIVSVPCSNQSGMGAAVRFNRPIGPLASDCRNGAAKAGDPGAGPITRQGLGPDYFYVDGTPVMAMLYGIDVAAEKRWGRAPDLVLSGPNEGQNVGQIVLTSGTVSNAEHAAGRGIPAIALSAGGDTTGDAQLPNPRSTAVAALTLQLVKALDDRSAGKALLPPGVALNVNFPDRLEGAKWKLARIGTYNVYRIRFVEDVGATGAATAPGPDGTHLPGVVVGRNAEAPTPAQMDDESVVYRKDIAVSVMQAGYDHQPATRKWMGRHLRGLLTR